MYFVSEAKVQSFISDYRWKRFCLFVCYLQAKIEYFIYSILYVILQIKYDF